jgi:hypothetical protein
MRVAVEGHGCASVPKKVLDQFRMDAAPQKQRGACVPEIVPADRGEIRAIEQRLEVAVDYVLGVQRGALACGENEP